MVEIPGACQKTQGWFDNFCEALFWLARLSGFFGKNSLLSFQLFNAFFKGSNHGCVAAAHDLIESLGHILVDGVDLLGDHCLLLALLIETHLPGLLEHGFDDLKQVLAGLEGFQDILKAPFDICAADRLAAIVTAARLTEVVGMPLASSALRPGSCHGLVTAGTGDEATEGKVTIDVLAGRCQRSCRFALLDGFIGGQ